MMYELLCRILQGQAMGYVFSQQEKQEAVNLFLAGISSRRTVERYHQGVHQPPDGRQLYPFFYIPPYQGGKKLRLATGELPKTHLLAANYYELEILRILFLWGAGRREVFPLIEKTLLRLNTTCFARYCPTGECIGAGVAAFRLLSVIPSCQPWAASLLKPLGSCFDGIKGRAAFQNGIPIWYFVQTLSECGIPEAWDILGRNQPALLGMMKQASKSTQPEGPIRQAVTANALSLLGASAAVPVRPLTA